MCSNYLPVTSRDRLLTFFGVEFEKAELLQREVFPTEKAPFFRLSVEGQEGGKPALIGEIGHFGLLPEFAGEVQYGRRTYNCRSETVHQKPSFRPAWNAGQRCIVPADAVFEPNYESGKAVRWRIYQDGGVPWGIAGIYRRWRDPKSGQFTFTFTMLTVNCDTHPFYRRFHKPSDEKRMPIFLRRDQYGPWLTCELDEAPNFFQQYPGPFLGEADPFARAPKTSKEPLPKDEVVPKKKVATLLKPLPPEQGNLF